MNTAVRRAVRIAVLAAMSTAFAAITLAQDADETSLEEVVVTGSSIKGVAPVGSNLVTVGREQIEETGVQTVQQLLKTVPAVVGLQSAGQGGYGSFDGAGTNAPTIHGLGASASNSTLILLNGHRLPVSGINHVLADPNIVAPMALERVEVLADGASSVYGSDAVAGVVNFITRRNVEGIETSVQKGFADSYGTLSAGLLAGTNWDSGSFLFSYSLSDRDNLAAVDRDYARADQRARGGRNFTANRCGPASITVGAGAAATTYYTPYATAGAVAGDCDPALHSDLLPSEVRHSVFATVQQRVGERLTLTGDVIYSERKNVTAITRGNASATMFGPGAANAAQVSPFFRLPTGVAPTTTQVSVNFSGDALLGPGAKLVSTADTVYGRFDTEFELTDSWSLNGGFLFGLDEAKQKNFGQLCGSCFNLAVNGTTNGGGNTTAPSVPGTTTAVLNTPLTTANAFDPFGTGTSAAVLARLTDSLQIQVGDQTIQNVYFKLSGDVFNLPGGAAKLAIGGEYTDYKLDQDTVRPNNTGPASTGSATLNLLYKRDVKSVYAELYVPVIGEDQGVPGIRNLDLNISGRYDDYSDVGSTSNPKFAMNWVPFQGLKIRGNFAEAFVAPALTSSGSNQFGLTGESGFSGITGAALPGGAPVIQTASFPNAIGIPGCAVGATTCSVGGNVTGLLITGGNGGLEPQTGKSWSIGADFTPAFLPGFSFSVTHWNNRLRGGITAPAPALVLGAADLSTLMQFFPTGATPAQIAAAGAGLPQTGALNATTYFIYNFQQRNVLNLNVAGWDFAAGYRVSTGLGDFNFGATLTQKTKFDQFFGATGTTFSVLGTAGFNGTFPSVKKEARANFGYSRNAMSAILFVNHLGRYTNWSGQVANPVTRASGLPTGGGDPIAAFTTVDLNLSYKLSEMGVASELQLFADGTNILDRKPPQYNTFGVGGVTGAAGFDGINANALGSVVTVGVRAKF
jgi:iron complex outermembrane receptor protein